jgi:hypothetical protein
MACSSKLMSFLNNGLLYIIPFPTLLLRSDLLCITLVMLYDTSLLYLIKSADRHALTPKVAGFCRAFNYTTKGKGCILVSERKVWHGQARAFRSLGDVALQQHKHILASTPNKGTPRSSLRLALVAPTLPIP